MKPVDDKVIEAIKYRGNGSDIFSDENINTMLQNPAQWYELASSVNNENYLKIQASYVSSARYFRDKLKSNKKHRFRIQEVVKVEKISLQEFTQELLIQVSDTKTPVLRKRSPFKTRGLCCLYT